MDTPTPTIAQLVSTWNRLVQEAQSVGLTTYKPINSKFKDAQTGLRRIEALESSIRAAKASERAVAQEATAPAVVNTEVEADAPAQSESEEDMAKRKSKKARQKAATARTRAPRATANGASIAAKTQEFNDKVAEAKKLGVAWARRHSSLFGSHEAADKMNKKLDADMAKARRAS